MIQWSLLFGLGDLNILLPKVRTTFWYVLAVIVKEIQVLMEVHLCCYTKEEKTEHSFKMYCLWTIQKDCSLASAWQGKSSACPHQLAKSSGHHKSKSTARVSLGWLRTARALPRFPKLLGRLSISLTPECTSAKILFLGSHQQETESISSGMKCVHTQRCT